MPLANSASKEAVSQNIRTEIAAGKPQKQAVAIALSVQRRARGLKKAHSDKLGGAAMAFLLASQAAPGQDPATLPECRMLQQAFGECCEDGMDPDDGRELIKTLGCVAAAPTQATRPDKDLADGTGMLPRKIEKAHVKQHIRVVDGKLVMVHEHETKKQSGVKGKAYQKPGHYAIEDGKTVWKDTHPEEGTQLATLAQRSHWGENKNDGYFIRAANAKDAKIIAEFYKEETGNEPVKKHKGVVHHGNDSAFPHIIFGKGPKAAAELQAVLAKMAGVADPDNAVAGKPKESVEPPKQEEAAAPSFASPEDKPLAELNAYMSQQAGWKMGESSEHAWYTGVSHDKGGTTLKDVAKIRFTSKGNKVTTFSQYKIEGDPAIHTAGDDLGFFDTPEAAHKAAEAWLTKKMQKEPAPSDTSAHPHYNAAAEDAKESSMEANKASSAAVKVGEPETYEKHWKASNAHAVAANLHNQIASKLPKDSPFAASHKDIADGHLSAAAQHQEYANKLKEVGSIQVINGVTYVLNENHRWQKLDDPNFVNPESVGGEQPTEESIKANIKSWAGQKLATKDGKATGVLHDYDGLGASITIDGEPPKTHYFSWAGLEMMGWHDTGEIHPDYDENMSKELPPAGKAPAPLVEKQTGTAVEPSQQPQDFSKFEVFTPDPKVGPHAAAFANFMNNLKKSRDGYYAEHYSSLTPDKLGYDVGPKYIRVVTGGSVYAFMDKATGDLYKPAGYKGPAKGKRGSIYKGGGMDAAGPHGFGNYHGNGGFGKNLVANPAPEPEAAAAPEPKQAEEPATHSSDTGTGWKIEPEELIAVGGKEWKSDNGKMHRIYFNGLKDMHSGVEKGAKLWWDYADKQFHSKNMDESVASEIVAKIKKDAQAFHPDDPKAAVVDENGEQHEKEPQTEGSGLSPKQHAAVVAEDKAKQASAHANAADTHEAHIAAAEAHAEAEAELKKAGLSNLAAGHAEASKVHGAIANKLHEQKNGKAPTAPKPWHEHDWSDAIKPVINNGKFAKIHDAYNPDESMKPEVPHNPTKKELEAYIQHAKYAAVVAKHKYLKSSPLPDGLSGTPAKWQSIADHWATRAKAAMADLAAGKHK